MITDDALLRNMIMNFDMPVVDGQPIPTANLPVSQFQGLGEMMGKGADAANGLATGVGKFMGKPNMPGTLSNLAKMILAGGGVQGMPVNAIAKGANDMAIQKQHADLLNKAFTLPPTKPQAGSTTPNTPTPPAAPPTTRLGSLNESVFNRKPPELLPPSFISPGGGVNPMSKWWGR